MNCESWLPPKNSRTAATTGRVLMRAAGVTVAGSCRVMRSLMTRSMRSRPMRNWFCRSSPTARTRPVAQVIDVVRRILRIIELDEPPHDVDQVLRRERAHLRRRGHSEALIEFVAPHTPEVVPAPIEECRLNEILGVIQRYRIAGADALVDLAQAAFVRVGRIAPLRALLPADGGGDVRMIGVVVNLTKELVDFGISAVAYGSQQGRDRNGAAFVYLDGQDVLGAGLELQPGAAIGYELRAVEIAAAGRVLAAGCNRHQASAPTG